LLFSSSSLILSYVLYYDSRWAGPDRSRLALSLFLLTAAVLCLDVSSAAEGPLSGAFSTTITYDDVSASLALDAELEAKFDLDLFAAEASTKIENASWTMQAFSAELTLESISVDSTLRFEPDRERFKDWKTEIALEAGPWEAEIESKLTRTRRWLHFDVDWTSDDADPPIELGGRARLRAAGLGNPLLFYDLQVDAETTIAGIEGAFEIRIDADGFDELAVELSGLPVPALPWISFELAAERTAVATTLEIGVTADFGGIGSVRLEAAEVSGPTFEPFDLSEIVLDGEVGPIEIEATTRLDPDDWIDDVYPFTLELSLEAELREDRKLEAELALFDVGEPFDRPGPERARAAVEFELTDALTLSLEVDLADRPTEVATILVGVDVAW